MTEFLEFLEHVSRTRCQIWLPNRDCSWTLRSGSSRTPFRVRELIVCEHIRDEHGNCRTNVETNTLQIGEHVHELHEHVHEVREYVREHTKFVTQWSDILHIQKRSLCVTMFILIPFNSSLKATHNSLLNNIGRIKTCVTFWLPMRPLIYSACLAITVPSIF